jgi:hypothetical protein
MRCKCNVPIQQPQQKTTSRGQPMVSGTCPTCSTKVNRFISAEQQKALFAKPSRGGRAKVKNDGMQTSDTMDNVR